MLLVCASSCTTESDEYIPTGAPEETEGWEDGGKADSPSPGPSVPLAEQSADIGQFFMIDHFGVTTTGFGHVRTMIREKNLGSIILWNPTGANGETLRQMLRGYSQTAQTAGRDELFYAADHEELATQRFTGAHGFTSLVRGNVLGANSSRICDLHARITARELASVGMNMSLGTVADLYVSDSGTRGMFRTRAIGSDVNVVSECVTAMTRAYAEEQNVVFITKHFPGLGNATGNTDVDLAVKTRARTTTAMEREIAPYRTAIAAAGASTHFGAMISHASYPVIDGGALPATLSKKMLTDFLRSPTSQQLSLGGTDSSGAATRFAGMGFRGLAVSDAFWTWGAMRGLEAIKRQRMMAQTFLAGMDILMIAKTEFNGAWSYFQLVWSDRLPEAEKAELVRAAGYASWTELRAAFRARVLESAARIKTVKTSLGRITAHLGAGPATAASSSLIGEYRDLAN